MALLPDTRSPLRTAWLVVALLWPVALLNYLDRQLLASMKTSVMEAIPSIGSQENWGYMLGQFKWVYAAVSPLGGLLADRCGRRWVICGSLFVWSAVTWWTGHVGSYHELLWARSLMGISEACYIPAALALIADHHGSATRSRAVGLHQMAIYCGVILGGFGGYVADDPRLGWRMAFDICGFVGMAYALPLAVLLVDGRRPPAAASGGDTSVLRTLLDLIVNPSFILLVLFFTLPALAGWVVRDWMPAILKERFAIGQGQAGVSATLYWQLAAIVGAAGGGWLADRWMRVTPRGRINTSALGMTLIVAALFGIATAFGDGSGSLGAAIAALVVFGLGWGLFDINNMPILCQIAPARQRATGYGLMNMVSIACGGLADWGFGLLRDRGVPLGVIFAGFASCAIVSLILVLLIRPRPELLGDD